MRRACREPVHEHDARGPAGDARGDRRRLARGALRPPDPRRGALRPRARPPAGHARAGRLRAPARAGRAQRLGRGRDLLPRRRHVRPLRARGRRHAHGALGVPDAVHALPAGGLAGRAAGDVRVPDGDQRAHRAAGLERERLRGAERGRRRRVPREDRQRQEPRRRLEGGPSAQPRDAAHDGGRVRGGGRRGRHARRRHRPRCVGCGDRSEHQRGRLPEPEPPRRRRGRERAGAGGEGLAGGRHRLLRPHPARHPHAAGRVRRRRRRRGGPDARQPPGLRRPVLRPLCRHRRVPAPNARPHRGRDAGRRWAPRIRAPPADAGAAHPPREGDLEHLHRAGAERARRRRVPVVARPPRARRARRADPPAHALRARGADRPRRRRGAARAAGRARVRREARCAGRRRARALRGAGRGGRRAARSGLPRVRGRPARGDHRAPLARRHRPSRRGARRRGGGGAAGGGRSGGGVVSGEDVAVQVPAQAGIQSPLQRERARTIFEKGAPGRRAFTCPELDVPEADGDALLPPGRRRSAPARLPEVSEPELVRHYVRLSKRNFDLDSGFYPLGSCTMKHNPRLHERVAALPGHARLHPHQRPARAQGALELMWRLERALSEVAGLPHVSLQPSAGSHGELAGVLLTKAYHADRGDMGRTKVLTPDTAHGTNPATVTMAGLEVVKVASNADGGVDIEDLKRKADDSVACLMLTNPNTLGIFDPHIEQITEIVRDAGATAYYDGANLNAIMGITRPGDMGFDIVHFNLHKSFTQPHGGGGPGSGPIAVSERMEPYLMVPRIVRRAEDGNGARATFDLSFEQEKSIGRLRGFQGNYGCFVRAYAYICSLGAEGLRDASETAVLNANYLVARLRELGVADRLPLAFGELCMHEFVLSGAPMKRDLKIRTLDLAKRLLDHGVHPPTVYFPLIVDEALLVEPTETETRETLDAFAEALAEILREAQEDPEVVRNAPYTTPVRRLDEAGAAKRPVIRQPLDEGEPANA